MSTESSPPLGKVRQASLRKRVLWVSLAWIALALVATGFVLNQLFEYHVQQQYQRQLQVYADYVLTGIDLAPQGEPQIDQAPQNPRFLTPFSGLYWQLNNAESQAVLRSRSLWDDQLISPDDVLPSGEVHFHRVVGPKGDEVLLLEQNIRFAAQPNEQWRLLVAENATDLMSSIRQWHQMLIIFLSVLFVSLGLAVFAQIVVGFAPLQRLQKSIEQLRSGKVARLEGSYPSEFSTLVTGLNRVLDANETMVERARTQAGDLAHAIKTPITVMTTALEQVPASQADSDEMHRLLQEQLTTLRSQVDWHLRRARLATASPGLAGRVCEVEPVVEQVLRVMRQLHIDRGVQFSLAMSDTGLKFAGESQDLGEMVANLLDNAGKWAATEVQIRIELAPSLLQNQTENQKNNNDNDNNNNNNKHRLLIIVEDDGPGIAASQRARALRRGARMDEQVPGSGLGLAIVKDLVQSYQGVLELEVSRLGGLLARLRLPGRSN